MKSSNQHILEYLIINKDYRDNVITVKSFDELRNIIEDRYDKLGPGTEQNPVDFNDIDISNIDSFCKKNNEKGIFEKTKFEYIDISDWNVSNVENMGCMFHECTQLKSIGDLSNWDISNVKNMSNMFYGCEQLKSVGDLSDWDVSNVKDMNHMFHKCEYFNCDLSNWDVSNVTGMYYMFGHCKQFDCDLSHWNTSKVKDMKNMFTGCNKLTIPDWYKK